jgi:hypothetical protein
MHVLRVGCLAYLDSFAGLVPCKVLSIDGTPYRDGVPSTQQHCRFVITDALGAYRKGEVLDTYVLHVVPRPSIHVSSVGNLYIRQYRVEQTEPATQISDYWRGGL